MRPVRVLENFGALDVPTCHLQFESLGLTFTTGTVRHGVARHRVIVDRAAAH